MTRSYHRIILLSILITWPLTAVSQVHDSLNIYDSVSTQYLREVVVSAYRFESFQSGTPEAIRILTSSRASDFQLRSAPEALIETPGVFVQKTNHGGGSPFLRGLTGNQTLLMIDGIRLSNATARSGPNQYFNTIDLFSISRIEVLRGNGSVQYGSDALGGTLQAFSREISFTPDPETEGTLITRFASGNMEQTLRASLDHSGNNMAMTGGFTLRDFGDIIGGDTTGVQSPTGYKESDFDIKGMFRFSDATTLSLVYQHVRQHNVPVFHKIELENYEEYKMNPQSRNLGYIRLTHFFEKMPVKEIRITGSLHTGNEGREMRKNGSSTTRFENDRVRSLGFIAETVISDGSLWSSSNGIELYHDFVNSSRTDIDELTGAEVAKRGLYPDGSMMTSAAVFSLHSFDLSKWKFTAGARLSTFNIRIEDELSGVNTTINPSAIVGNLTAARKVKAGSSIFISGNTGFRAPNIDDLGSLGIVDFRYEVPNHQLKPEYSFQYQAGYKLDSRRIKGELYLYRNDLFNLIVRENIPGDTIEGYPVYIKENVDRAFITGVETDWSWQVTSLINLSGSLTYTYGQNITRNEPLRRIPPLFGRMAAGFNKERVQITAELSGAASQDRLAPGDISDNRIPPGGTPGWLICNIYAGYKLKFLGFQMGMLNITNRDYRYHGSGVNGYGRSFLITITISI